MSDKTPRLSHYAGPLSVLVRDTWRPACLHCGSEVIFGEECPDLLKKWLTAEGKKPRAVQVQIDKVLSLDFSGDEDGSELDFSFAEGQALVDQGYEAFHAQFIGEHTQDMPTRGIEGKRWLWLIKYLTPTGTEVLAASVPELRLNNIAFARRAVKVSREPN